MPGLTLFSCEYRPPRTPPLQMNLTPLQPNVDHPPSKNKASLSAIPVSARTARSASTSAASRAAPLPAAGRRCTLRSIWARPRASNRPCAAPGCAGAVDVRASTTSCACRAASTAAWSVVGRRGEGCSMVPASPQCAPWAAPAPFPGARNSLSPHRVGECVGHPLRQPLQLALPYDKVAVKNDHARAARGGGQGGGRTLVRRPRRRRLHLEVLRAGGA